MNHAIILAAGKGKRLSSKSDKMLAPVCGMPLIYFTIMAFNDCPNIDSITIVASKSNQKAIKDLAKENYFRKVTKVILGSDSRQQSLEKGFKALSASPDDTVLVHNGANPLVSQEEIVESIRQCQETGACIVGHPVTSTIKEICHEEGKVLKTHDRKKLFAAETPQSTQYKTLKRALDHARKNKLAVTDEAMLLEAIGQRIAYIPASEDNFKVTTPKDLTRLRNLLGEQPEDFHVGIGQDSHHFDEEALGLTLGGLHFPDHPKLKANSDGDVILHAIFNAISQSIGDKSLGFYADPMCEQGITDSRQYLKPLLTKLKKRKLKLNTIGLMLECKDPKIDPISTKLKRSLSEIFDLKPAKIGITATSGEHLTPFGAGLGIQCFAIISLKKNTTTQPKSAHKSSRVKTKR